MFPLRWQRRLRAAGANAATFDLAITVLAEQFKLEQMAIKEIVLSEQVTGLSRRVRGRAIAAMKALGLMQAKRRTGRAFRVTDIRG